MISEEERLEDLQIDNLKIVQKTNLYRYTSDSILLSKFARVKMGDEVADFCAGSGIVGLHFYALHPKEVKHVTFFEMQEELADMSRKTIEINRLTDRFSVECCRVQALPAQYIEKFSLILCNPPYERNGFENSDPQKAVCRKEILLPLEELVFAAWRAVKYGGRFVLCHRADRLSEVFCVLHAHALEPKRLQLVSGTEKGKPYLVLVEAVKGGKPGLDVLPVAVNGHTAEE